MANFIDRRQNPKDKNLGNRRRFLGRVRATIKRAVNEAVRKRGIADVNRGGTVTVPPDGTSEPQFQHAREGGHRERVLPGNKKFQKGDHIAKPAQGGSGRGSAGAPDGDGEDDFTFVLSRDEFLDIFFEDLELPDLVKRTLTETPVTKPRRAGTSVTGVPSNLNVARTMQNALGRRLALKRPSNPEVDEVRARIFELEAVHAPTKLQRDELAALREALKGLLTRQKRVPWIDPVDVRYRHFEQHPEPSANAVMFCLMDVSASMGQREKDLAKRFFVLLHLFLTRQYERVELVFIRHTHQATEVDEETFFHGRETGGTVVSTALSEMKKIITARYPPTQWNIYAAQASDGDNTTGDSARCASLLTEELLPYCQYFAYVEILQESESLFLTSEDSGTELWKIYRQVARQWPHFATKRIAKPSDIYPVFRELFAPKRDTVSAA